MDEKRRPRFCRNKHHRLDAIAAHSSLAFKPKIAEQLNQLIDNLPQDVLEQQIELLGSKEDLTSLPNLFVNTKHFGAPPGRVSTLAVTISCVYNRIRLMKELISLIPYDDLPYTFIPMGLATMETPEVYKKYIVINNDRQNAVQEGITVKGFSKELLTRLVKSGDKKARTVEEYLTSHNSIVSIQETHQSQEFGKYIVLVFKAGYPEPRSPYHAQRFLRDQIQTDLPHLSRTLLRNYGPEFRFRYFLGV